VAEWLGRGLQSLAQRFDSARRLLQHADVTADDLGMKRSTAPRIETRRLVRRGESTIEVRVIDYPATRKPRPGA
jgi:hypothetical protein